MEQFIDHLRNVTFKDKTELIVAVREQHKTSNEERTEHGLHWHLLIDFGDGSKRRTAVNYQKIKEVIYKFQKNASAHFDTASKGVYENIIIDVLEYFLKQISVEQLKLEKNKGRYMSRDQFDLYRNDNFVGDWDDAFSRFLNRNNIESIKKMKTAELVGYTIQKLREGKTFQEIFDDKSLDVECQGKLASKMKTILDTYTEINKVNVETMKMKELPPCPIFPQWAPVAHSDDLLEHHKRTHLYIYGDANTGKTSFAFRWAKENNLKICKAPMGHTMKFDEEKFKNADVILVDDLQPPRDKDGKDPNAFEYSTLLSWTNGDFIISQFKKNISTKPKILIITSNFVPSLTLPMDIPQCKQALDARFHYWKTTKCDKKWDSTEGNIVVKYINYLEAEKLAKKGLGQLGDIGIVPESPPQEIPATPPAAQAVDFLEDIECSNNVLPGCHSQEDVFEVDNPKKRLLTEDEAVRYAMVDFMFTTGQDCNEFKKLPTEDKVSAFDSARTRTLEDFEELKGRLREALLERENERRANEGWSQEY